MENFDEDVVGKLKIRQENDAVRVDQHTSHFWQLAVHLLSGHISNVTGESRSFHLDNALNEEVPAGEYTFSKDNDGNFIRVDSPMGRYILDHVPDSQPRTEEVTFDLTGYHYRSVILEEQKYKKGYLVAYRVSSVNQYDGEDTLICCAYTDDGTVLSSEFGPKILELTPTSIQGCEIPDSQIEKANHIFEERLERHKADVEGKLSDYANFEIEKFESWSDDRLVPLQNEVIEIRKEKDAIHRQIRKERGIKARLLLKREELALSDKLRRKQSQLFEMEDKYRKQVDSMTSRLLDSLNCKFDVSVLFKIRWIMA